MNHFGSKQNGGFWIIVLCFIGTLLSIGICPAIPAIAFHYILGVQFVPSPTDEIKWFGGWILIAISFVALGFLSAIIAKRRSAE